MRSIPETTPLPLLTPEDPFARGWFNRCVRYEAQLAQLEAQLAQVRAQQLRIEFERDAMKRQYERMGLCPDHRDKFDIPAYCIVCRAEERTRREIREVRALATGTPPAPQTEGE